jgi:hypothetical protein
MDVSRTLLGFPLQSWGIICLVAAVAYLFKWPRPRTGASGPARSRLAHLVLRWGHSAVWATLAIACFLWARGPSLLANVLALLALIIYLVFLFTLISDRRTSEAR